MRLDVTEGYCTEHAVIRDTLYQVNCAASGSQPLNCNTVYRLPNNVLVSSIISFCSFPSESASYSRNGTHTHERLLLKRGCRCYSDSIETQTHFLNCVFGWRPMFSSWILCPPFYFHLCLLPHGLGLNVFKTHFFISDNLFLHSLSLSYGFFMETVHQIVDVLFTFILLKLESRTRTNEVKPCLTMLSSFQGKQNGQGEKPVVSVCSMVCDLRFDFPIYSMIKC